MRSTLRAFLIRFALVAALLVTWSCGIGRYGGPDEPAHVLRAYAAAHGDVLGDPADPLPPGFRFVSVPAALASGDPACYRHDPLLTSRCAAANPAPGTSAGNDMVRVGTSAGLTPPLYHLFVGAVVRLVGDPADSAWYRLVAALLHAAVVALALTRMRHRPAGMALVVAAITPATWFLFGVMNPNSLEIALALLGWVGVMRAIEAASLSRRDAWWIGGPAAIAIAIRPIAVVALLAMVLVVELRCRPGPRRWLIAAAPAIAVLAGTVWNTAVGMQVDDPRTAVDQSLWHNVTDVVTSLPTTAVEAVGSLGWLEYRTPVVASLSWLGIVVVLVLVFVPTDRPWRLGRAVWSACAWAAILVMTPVVFEVALAGQVGPIWQGRYSLPILVGVTAVLTSSRSRRSRSAVDGAAAGGTCPPAALVAAMIGTALVEVVTYWATVRRYAVGTHGSWWLRHAGDSTTLMGPRAWLLTHLMVVGAIVGPGVRRSSRTRRR